MRGRHWKVLPFAMIIGFGVAACGGGDQPADDPMTGGSPAAADEGAQEAPSAPANLPEGVTAQQVSQGQQLFTGQGGCHACHGPQATGTQLAPDLTDDVWINISGPNMDEIVQLIHTGVPQPKEHPGPMPPMGGANLTDDQIQALAAYVMTLGQG